ncbi:hypothetical protein GH714_042877 [Hevea brasiliensis]|uniref:3'-5' exonuclease domain-containing protein n=1 Tax=Hevea brasiliensis TaxID=3981 RepID=A0A6A6K149_HEVBR|nr:hypothetical protein GH714_042877 [Hevea brasiliensis]
MAVFVHSNDLPDGLDLGGIIAVDTETMGLVCRRDRVCLVQLSSGDGDAHLVKFSGDYSAPNLRRIISNQDIMKIFHFARFDVAAIRHCFGMWAIPCYCTKIASSKAQQSSDWGREVLTSEQLSYAAADVIYLHDIKKKLDMMLEREDKQELAESCFKFIPARAELDLLGWDGVDIFSHQTQL